MKNQEMLEQIAKFRQKKSSDQKALIEQLQNKKAYIKKDIEDAIHRILSMPPTTRPYLNIKTIGGLGFNQAFDEAMKDQASKMMNTSPTEAEIKKQKLEDIRKWLDDDIEGMDS